MTQIYLKFHPQTSSISEPIHPSHLEPSKLAMDDVPSAFLGDQWDLTTPVCKPNLAMNLGTFIPAIRGDSPLHPLKPCNLKMSSLNKYHDIYKSPVGWIGFSPAI